MAVRKLKIYVEDKSSHDGRKFKSYTTATKNGVKMAVKFRKEVKDTPDESCFIVVNDDNMNEQKNTIYPTLWVNKIEGIEPLGVGDKEANAKRMTELFGEVEESSSEE